MATTKKPKTGAVQAKKPAKSGRKLNNGLDPSIGQATQWKPGQSGNPAGKPAGTKHLSTWIREMLTDETFVQKVRDKLGREKELTGPPLEAILKTMIAKAVSGDARMADLLFEYGYGKKIDVTSGDKPIPILSGVARPQKKVKKTN